METREIIEGLCQAWQDYLSEDEALHPQGTGSFWSNDRVIKLENDLHKEISKCKHCPPPWMWWCTADAVWSREGERCPECDISKEEQLEWNKKGGAPDVPKSCYWQRCPHDFHGLCFDCDEAGVRCTEDPETCQRHKQNRPKDIAFCSEHELWRDRTKYPECPDCEKKKSAKDMLLELHDTIPALTNEHGRIRQALRDIIHEL